MNLLTKSVCLKLWALLAVSGLGLFAWGCDKDSSGTPGRSGGKLKVATTTTMIGDLVHQIGGDRVELQVMMPPGTDPHTYKPSPGDIAMLRNATVVFYNGLHLEGTMVEQFEDKDKLGNKSIAISNGLPEDRLLAWDGGQGGVHDPHLWFDVSLWSLAAGQVKEGLIKHDPDHATEYEQRANGLAKQMTDLHEWVRTRISTIPKAQRVLITSHDAYNYFKMAYDIDVRGLQGISTESEAGIQAVNSAVDFIIKNKVPAIFVESSVSPKTIQRVQEDCKSRGFDVKIGGELYSDAMGKPGEHPGYAVETYEGMVRYNVETIVAALAATTK